MSNYDGKIYIDTSSTPNVGVSVADLQTVLGVNNENDFGRLSVNSSVKMFAKYKPLRSSKLGMLTELERRALNYGISFSTYNSAAGIATAYDNGTGWEYLKPRGLNGGGTGVHEWYRPLDFANPNNVASYGYNHGCVSFIASVDVPSTYQRRTDTGNVGYVVRGYWTPSNQLPSGNVSWADLSIDGTLDLDDMYFGIIIKKGSSYYAKTASSTIGSNAYVSEVEILDTQMNALGDGTYYVYPFIYNSQLSWGTVTSLVSGALTLPGISRSQVTISSAAASTSAVVDNLTASVPTTSLLVEFDIKAVGDGGTPITNMAYTIYGGDNPYDTTTALDGGTGTFNNITPGTTPTVYYHVTYNRRVTFPSYVTVVFTYRVGNTPVTDTKTTFVDLEPI